jgi:ferric-dicitrate binding protein FerR (iron transport regulator)
MKQQEPNIDKELLYRVIAGIADKSEIETVEIWIAADSKNKTEFDKIKEIRELSESAKDLDSFDSEIALKKVKIKIHEKNAQKKFKINYPLLKIAAVVVLFVGIYWLIKDKNSNRQATEMMTIAAKSKQRIVLPDSTVVFLNSGSELKYPKEFTDTIRKVEFTGEAYFVVHKNAKQPFVISSESTQVRVLGTEFNFKSASGANEVTLVVTEGKVRFSYKDKCNVALLKGEKGTINKSLSKVEKQINTDKNFMAWKTGKFEFENTPLPDALNSLSTFYNITFDIQKSSLKTYLLSTKLDSLSESDLISVLQLTLGEDFEKIDNVYVLK